MSLLKQLKLEIKQQWGTSANHQRWCKGWWKSLWPQWFIDTSQIQTKAFFFCDRHSIVAWITQGPIVGLFYLISSADSSGERGLKCCWGRVCLAWRQVRWLSHLRLFSHRLLPVALSSLSLSVMQRCDWRWGQTSVGFRFSGPGATSMQILRTFEGSWWGLTLKSMICREIKAMLHAEWSSLCQMSDRGGREAWVLVWVFKVHSSPSYTSKTNKELIWDLKPCPTIQTHLLFLGKPDQHKWPFLLLLYSMYSQQNWLMDIKLNQALPPQSDLL